MYLMPGVAKVVAVGVSHSDEGLDGVDVFLLHLRDAGAGCQQGKASEGLDIGVAFQLKDRPRSTVTPPTAWPLLWRAGTPSFSASSKYTQWAFGAPGFSYSMLACFHHWTT